MKRQYLFFIAGLFVGIIITLGISKFKLFSEPSPEMKREAILYAQKLLNKKYANKERKISFPTSSESEKNKTELIFPPISKTKVDYTDYKTFVVHMKVTYKGGRWVEDNYSAGTYTKKHSDFFVIELDNKNDEWNLIEMKTLEY